MTVGMFVGSAVLLLAFVLVESRVKAPLLPLRVITERNEGRDLPSRWAASAIIAMFGLLSSSDLLPADREGATRR